MTSDVRAALEAGDDGFHEIQLNGKQLVFLGMATTLVSVVIFLCGVLVGRGVQPLGTVAQAAGPQAFEGPAPSSVAPGAITSPDPAPAPAPSGSGAAAAGAAVTDGAGDTEPTPLGDEAESPAPTEVAAAAAPAAPKPVAPAVAPKVEKKVEKKDAARPAPAQATAVPPATTPDPAPVAPAPRPTPEPAPAAVASTAPATAGGRIAVQVGAFKTRTEADALARRLSGRGYAVYVMPPTSDGKNVYRVRVGNYASADEAQRVSARLTSQEKLKPWVIR